MALAGGTSSTFIAADPGANPRSVVVERRAVLLGACIVAVTLISFGLDYEYVRVFLSACGWIVADVAVIRYLFHQKSRRLTMIYLLVIFNMLLVACAAWSWGTNITIGLVVFGVIIVLSSVPLKARHALLVAMVAGLMLVAIQTAITSDWHMLDTSRLGMESYYADAVAYCAIFGMLALIAWMHNRGMEVSLRRAKKAEADLLQQRAAHRRTVEKRTTQLRHAQLEEMQQMYRFAELGQLGVTLLHDLANHLTALTLEIEGMQTKQNAKALVRAQEITGQLEAVVDNTRSRLHGDTQKQTFNIVRVTGEVVTFMGYKAEKAKVRIDWMPPASPWGYTGDPTCFSQVVAILIGNAIDAYGGDISDRDFQEEVRKLGVTMWRDKECIAVVISDWGVGIPKSQRRHLFKPFHTTKKSGLGIGLFIARQTVEANFNGTIVLNSRSDHTEFIVKLPVQDREL